METSHGLNTRLEEKKSEEGYSSSTGENISDANPIILYKIFLKRFMDDDRLSDSCWNLEMREVEGKREIWRQVFFFVHQFSQAQILLHILHPRPVRASQSQLPLPLLPFHSQSRLLLHCRLLLKSWPGSKHNLRNGEGCAWTRGMDGWSPVVGSNASDVEGASTCRKRSVLDQW